MPICPLQLSDLNDLAHLQPPDWPDIVVPFQFYLASPVCHPVKYVLDHQIAGVGTSFHHADSAWLAHIVVGPQFRNRGLGGDIVGYLLQSIAQKGIHHISLEATALGYPVYLRQGFQVVGQYHHYLNETQHPNDFTLDPAIQPAKKMHYQAILELDAQATGEKRRAALHPHLAGAQVYCQNETVRGFYLPRLGDGPIIAADPVAGKALSRMRWSEQPTVSLHSANRVAMNWAAAANLPFIRLGYRMQRGPALSWRAEMIFNRTSGALG